MEQQKLQLSYSQLLKSNKRFRNLFLGDAISILGDWFNTIALLGLVYATTKSGLMVSLTLIARALPALFISPFAGVLVDRFDKKKIMIVTDVIRSILALGLIFADQYIWLLFIVNILFSVSGVFFSPARQSVIPSIVEKNALPTANALSSATWGVMSIIGASFGGLVAEVVSFKATFIMNSVSFLISAWFITITHFPQIDKTIRKQAFVQDMKEGYQFILKTPIIFSLIAVGVSWGIVGGAYQVLLTIYASEVFHAGDTGIGILYAVQGLGVIIGSFIVSKIVGNNNDKMKSFFGWSYLLQGVFFLLFVFSPNIYVGIVFLLGMRIAGGIIIPLDTTLIQKYTPSELMGKVFSLHGSVFTSVMQISMFLTGVLLEIVSPRMVGSIFGSICLFTSILFLFMLYTNRLSGHEPNVQEELSR